MKALVVDDDRVLADVLAFTLRREGFTVVQAFDGETALELWQTEQPDLVVLDVNLPRLDGFSVCRRIRAQRIPPFCCSRCGTTKKTSSTASAWGPTITSPSRSVRASWWPAPRRFCGGPELARPTRCRRPVI